MQATVNAAPCTRLGVSTTVRKIVFKNPGLQELLHNRCRQQDKKTVTPKTFLTPLGAIQICRVVKKTRNPQTNQEWMGNQILLKLQPLTRVILGKQRHMKKIPCLLKK
ncbi:Hypothetical predicted protein [Octopus vulgaris]|uniref:Uncharacterized protein n=1 Tax=Octopus vulgaris TaxID=6645 RepID=A0AA36BJ70_OCTVU|nr:Hypothetical predicted protein [Octopus vulgaris]